MTDVLCTVTLEATNGIARDNSVNTFALHSDTHDADTELDRTAITNALEGFYNDTQAIGEKVSFYLSPSRKRTVGGMVMRAYDITGKTQRVRGVNGKGVSVWKTPNVGSPIWTEPKTLGVIGGVADALPAEVAVVMSLRSANRASALTEAPNDDADSAPDRPKSRNTGRLFIGPLARQALGQNLDGEIRVASNMRDVLVQAAAAFQTELAAAGWEWSIWSRADGTLREVHEVVVDNSFDTQRRRGYRATASTTAIVS